jgi:hypothetical protein
MVIDPLAADRMYPSQMYRAPPLYANGEPVGCVNVWPFPSVIVRVNPVDEPR